MLNRERLNTVRLNSPAAGAALPDYTTGIAPAYRVEVRSPAGVCLWWVTEAYGGQVWSQVNQGETAQFTAPYSAGLTAVVAYPNEVWIWKGDAADPWKKLPIAVKTDGETERAWITVECEGYLQRLGREWVGNYATGAAGKTVVTILAELLAYQTISPAVTLGVVDNSVGLTTLVLDLEGVNVLGALQEIEKAVGRHFWVDARRRLHWRVARARDAGYWIRPGHNAQQLRRRTDYRSLTTRLEGRGFGVTEATRLTATVNDLTAQGTYGVLVDRVTHPNVKSVDTLEAMLTAELGRRALPKVTYHQEVIDLGALRPVVDYNFDAGMVTEGMPVRLLGRLTDIEATAEIQSITWDLDNPERVQVATGDPLGGVTAWGGNDPQGGATDVLDHILDVMLDVDHLEGDTGVVDTLEREIGGEDVGGDPLLDDLGDVLHWNADGLVGGGGAGGGTGWGNVGGKIDEVLTIPYGTTGYETQVDGAKESIVETIIEALQREDHASHDELVTLLGGGVVEIIADDLDPAHDETVDAIGDAVTEVLEDDLDPAHNDLVTAVGDTVTEVLGDALDPAHGALVAAIGGAIEELLPADTALVDEIHDALVGSGTPAAVTSVAGVAGTSEKFAPFDHTHQGLAQPASVSTFPNIPATGDGMVLVHINKGRADDQHWSARNGYTAWRAQEAMTDLTGAPGS